LIRLSLSICNAIDITKRRGNDMELMPKFGVQVFSFNKDSLF
jgi:hypothetical protein